MARKRSNKSKKKDNKSKKAVENRIKGTNLLASHPMFAPLLSQVSIISDHRDFAAPENGWAQVYSDGTIYVHPTKIAKPNQWQYIIAHCLLHLGMEHFKVENLSISWNIACDCYIAKFLADLKLGEPPFPIYSTFDFENSEEKIYQRFSIEGIPDKYKNMGMAGFNTKDMVVYKDSWRDYVDWGALLGNGISRAVTHAVSVAGGYEHSGSVGKITQAEQARRWFISNYPLLGALAATFRIVEDPIICSRWRISIAAVDEQSKEIFMNNATCLTEEECRFVMAHELLHVGLRHQGRCQGRDPYLWNVACDFVINDWLIEMKIGEIPQFGLLYDPKLKGLSAESVYDRIVNDMRYYKKVATLRGIGLGDIFTSDRPSWDMGDVTDLDDFYRQCLSQGLAYHQSQERGFLPSGLIEEIQALSQPPIPWDVELAQWFDNYFLPLEKRRTYARPSRRQSSTPDIPRPRWILDTHTEDARTYAVVLDTSGSMDRKLLAKALGTIASYSISRDVPAVRVVFCDAVAYDQGYMPPEDIAQKVKVRGRGGTILQPGIDLLTRAEDFPKKGPILIITDGYCDRLQISREHAFLIPQGNRLPFIPKGKVFRMA